MKAKLKVSLRQACDLMIAQPHNAIVLEGDPGTGKTFGTTAMLRDAGYEVVRIDAQSVPSDWLVALPVIDKDDPTKVIMASHEMWKPRPKLAFLIDELYKAERHIIDAFLPLVFGNEFMGNKYGDDTIRVITTNGKVFGLGDRELPHMGNRTTRLVIRDMDISEATAVMMSMSYDHRILRWAENNGAVLCSFNEKLARLSDTEDTDYFGYKPSDPTRKFCSMRSLEIASDWLRLLDTGISKPLVRTAVAGAIGERAAISLFKDISKKKVGEKLPTYKDMLAGKFSVETISTWGKRDMVMNLACNVTEKDKTKVAEVMSHFDDEMRALFARYVVHKPWALKSFGNNKEWESLVGGI